jgi:hypothetical protein
MALQYNLFKFDFITIPLQNSIVGRNRIQIIDTRLSSGRMLWLLAPPPPSSVSSTATHMKTEEERQLGEVTGGEWGGRGAESYAPNKAWCL